MHVLVFGGTSSMGLRALPLLHEAGHTLVAYVRSPSKIPDVAKAWVEIIEGTLEEGDKVRALFQREQAFDAIRQSPYSCALLDWRVIRKERD